MKILKNVKQFVTRISLTTIFVSTLLLSVITPVFAGELACTTDNYQGVGNHWAILAGTVVDTGNSDRVTLVGFDYGLTRRYGSSWTDTGKWFTGESFYGRIEGLGAATTYYYRAKIYDGSTWAYGEHKIFSTKGSPVVYEDYTTGGDGDSNDIYGVNFD